MASTFTDLGIELMATGENAGTWGTKTNANLNLIEQLTGGFLEVSIAGGAQTTALDIDNGALTGKAQNRVLKLTGTITGNQIVTFPLLTENFYIIENGTTGAFTVQLKAVSGSGATVTFATDDKGYKFIYLDGVATNTGVFEAVLGGTGDVTLNGVQTLTNKTLTSPKIGTSILDTNGAELFKLTATSSAVNELTYANAATGNKPTLTASGDDTNIGVSIQPKGSGQITLDALTFPAADGSADQFLKTDGGGNLSFSAVSGGTQWQSAVKTATFTAVAGEGYFINTAGGAFEVDLPSSPSVGDEIEFVDFSRSFATENLTLDQGSNKFQGFTTPKPVYDQRGQNIKIVYSGSTQGWIPARDGTVTDETPQTYTGHFVVVAGGGGGGHNRGGGGGAGGYRSSYNSESSGGGGSAESALAFSEGIVYTITVGDGGAGSSSGSATGVNGGDSTISGSNITDVTSTGGGGGGSSSSVNGATGGSGGGGCGNPVTNGASGTANQGFAGANGSGAPPNHAGGGGGAGEAGNTDGTSFGGDGVASTITGSSVTRGGGGGGNFEFGSPPNGGAGGGGFGGGEGFNATAGTANTGGGGGGGSGGGGAPSNSGFAAGSGVVILRVPTTSYSGTTTGSPTVTTDGSDKVMVFNGDGSYTG